MTTQFGNKTANSYDGLKSALIKLGVFSALQRTKVYQDRRAKIHFEQKVDGRSGYSADELPKRRKVVYSSKNKVKQITQLFNEADIALRPGARFQSWIDMGLYLSAQGRVLGNNPPDYTLVIDSSLEQMREGLRGLDNATSQQGLATLDIIENYIHRVVKKLDMLITETTGAECDQLIATRDYFLNMQNKRAESLEEALQRILFWSSMFWQTGRNLVGFGRLDKLLARFAGTEDGELQKILSDFLVEAHRYYQYKSNILIGDTGQIIILGGLEENGEYYCNEFTYAFIKALTALRLPDPKILLRISTKTPRDLMLSAVKCVATGIGCPLFANDDVIIPKLIEFGYSPCDAYNYVTSACWEPSAYGRSLEANSAGVINCADAFVATYRDDRFNSCKDMEEVLEIYRGKLHEQIEDLQDYLSGVTFERDPLLSLLTQSCAESDRDISEGGAVYNNYGVSVVGLPNTVNSLVALNEKCFRTGSASLDKLKRLLETDYAEDEDLRKAFASIGSFGTDNQEALVLANRITGFVYDACANFRNRFGGKLKWGLSSSSYVDEGNETGATLDGRKAGDPLAVHISASLGTPYTELARFAGQLDYAAPCNNGNVMDFFVTPSLLRGNESKFVDFLFACIDLGFFEMQMNVTDSKTLIEAKENPDEHTDLVVRVWGFSAYFVDLPEEYQDVLIERALEAEGRAA